MPISSTISVEAMNNRSSWWRANVNSFTNNELSMPLSNRPILVAVYWSNAIGAATGDYWTGVPVNDLNTVNGQLGAQSFFNVGINAGSHTTGTNTPYERQLSTENSVTDLQDGHSRWIYMRNAYNPQSGFYTDHGSAARWDISDANGMAAQADAFAQLSNTFDTNTIGKVRASNYSSYPQADTWTLEQYRPQLEPHGPLVAWVPRIEWWPQDEGECAAGISLPPGVQRHTCAGDWGEYVELSSEFYPMFNLRTRTTVNRYPSGNVAMFSDFNYAVSGNVSLRPPLSWEQEDNYFMAWTHAQLVGGPNDIATSDVATRFSWNFNNGEHTTSGGGNSAQWSDVDPVVLHYGPNTVLELSSTISGRRFQEPRTRTMGATLDSGVSYRRSHTKSFEFELDTFGDCTFKWDEDGTDHEHVVGTAEVNSTPETHIDMLVGRYYHGGTGSEFRISSACW